MLTGILAKFKKSESAEQPTGDVQVSGNIITYSPNSTSSPVPLLKDNRSSKLAIEITDEAKCVIAAKISRLLPDLIKHKKIELLEYTLHVLRALCKDQITKVRRMIAEELKENEDVPHELVLMLAWDKELEVSSPILQFSPILNDDDLIEIILASQLVGVSESISKRRKVSTRVSSAIVDKGVKKAVTLLLDNKGAEIAEESMLKIATQAEEYEIWQKPLLSRPELSMRVINRVAAYISDSMLSSLEEAGRLNPEVASSVRIAVKERLASPSAEIKAKAKYKAKELENLDLLTTEDVAEAIENGDREFSTQGLARLSGFSSDKVDRIIKSKNPSAVTALVWKAGLSMRSATQLQLRFAGIHHTEVLHPKGGTEFPVSKEKMKQLLEIFD